MASGVFAIRAHTIRMRGEVPQVLSEIPTQGETRKTKPLGESLLAIGGQGCKGEKVVTWAIELTLEQAKGK